MSVGRPETDQSLRFFPPAPCSCAQAIEIVTEAIAADNAGEFEKALGLYKRRVSRASRLFRSLSACASRPRRARSSLECFMTGVKYEKNKAGRTRSFGASRAT